MTLNFDVPESIRARRRGISADLRFQHGPDPRSCLAARGFVVRARVRSEFSELDCNPNEAGCYEVQWRCDFSIDDRRGIRGCPITESTKTLIRVSSDIANEQVLDLVPEPEAILRAISEEETHR